MIGKNSRFLLKSISTMSGLLLLSLSFVAYAIVNAQTEPSDRLILKFNNTVFDDPLRNAILTFSDGTTIFDTERSSDPSTGSSGMTRSDPTDSSNEATSSDSDSDSDSDSVSPTTTPTRTSSLDSSSNGPTGEVGSSTGEVGSSTGEVGSSTGEVGTSTGEVGP
jgi:hypothetical protein